MSEQPSVATPEDEAAAVQGLNTAEKHPDNGEAFEEPELAAPEGDPEEAVSEEELEAALAGVDPDDVDETGHDDEDIVIEPMTGATIPEEIAGLPELDDALI